MKAYFVGVDLGQSRDFTAIAVVEMVEVKGAWDGAAYAWGKDVVYQLRFLERVPLGTPYPEVVERVVAVTRARELAGGCHGGGDGTGGGRAGGDLPRGARPGGGLVPAVLTSGDLGTRG